LIKLASEMACVKWVNARAARGGGYPGLGKGCDSFEKPCPYLGRLGRSPGLALPGQPVKRVLRAEADVAVWVML
jgi:hypothetical protein